MHNGHCLTWQPASGLTMKACFFPAAFAAARNAFSWPGSCHVCGKKSYFSSGGISAANADRCLAMLRLRQSSSMPWKWLIRCTVAGQQQASM
eukprot:GHUV01052145.1.p1 GENE.GHUV01052145.1~~GHUV01052145.1.p1  ORF type:complete len:100 (+),score=25.08 GHUV01052145.1:25-300(+)